MGARGERAKAESNPESRHANGDLTGHFPSAGFATGQLGGYLFIFATAVSPLFLCLHLLQIILCESFPPPPPNTLVLGPTFDFHGTPCVTASVTEVLLSCLLSPSLSSLISRACSCLLSPALLYVPSLVLSSPLAFLFLILTLVPQSCPDLFRFQDGLNLQRGSSLNLFLTFSSSLSFFFTLAIFISLILSLLFSCSRCKCAAFTVEGVPIHDYMH